MGGDAGAGADVVHALVCLPLHADRRDVYAQQRGDARADCVNPRTQLRSFADYRRVDVCNAVAGGGDFCDDRLEKLRRVGALPLRVVVGEVRADVAERRRAKERVDEGVEKRVRVGVPVKPNLSRELHASEDETPALGEPVRVVSEADSHLTSPKIASGDYPA